MLTAMRGSNSAFFELLIPFWSRLSQEEAGDIALFCVSDARLRFGFAIAGELLQRWPIDG